MFEPSTLDARSHPPDIQMDDVSASYITPQSSVSTEGQYASRADLNTLIYDFSHHSISSSYDFNTALQPETPQTYSTHAPSLRSTHAHAHSVATHRLQRQLNVHLHNCTNQVRAISSLVENMVLSNTQCTLHPSPSRSSLLPAPPAPTSTPHHLEVDDTPHPPPSTSLEALQSFHDEGFSEPSTSFPLTLARELPASLSRRTETPHAIRKIVPAYQRSSDCAMAMHEQGKYLVRSRPRMRKRSGMVGSGGG